MSNNPEATRIISTTTSKDKAKSKAKSKSKTAQMKGQEADINVIGIPDLVAKENIMINGIGNLSGIWHLTSVKHSFSGTTYTCTAKATKGTGESESNRLENPSQNSGTSSSSEEKTIEINVKKG